MPDVTAPPFIITHPLIQLGAEGEEIAIQCAATEVDHAVDQDEKTVETFCGSYTSYGAEKHTITVTIAQSYGTDGAWTNIQPMVGTIVPFVLQPDTAAASIDNPVMSGDVLVKAFPFVSAAPGEASEIDLVLSVQGPPVFGIVAPDLMARKIVVDTSGLERNTRKLAKGLTAGGLDAPYHQALETAGKIRGNVPVRTGRLASTVDAVRVTGGYGVTYGGGLPYASVIEYRKHPVRRGARGSRVAFYRALQALTDSEVRRV